MKDEFIRVENNKIKGPHIWTNRIGLKSKIINWGRGRGRVGGDQSLIFFLDFHFQF
jgi:hypothetical protein